MAAKSASAKTTAKTALHDALREELEALLCGGGAHATLDEAVKRFPRELQGTAPDRLPYSGWQLLEHMRITQRDILDFCRNGDGSYKPLKWPQDYWPEAPAPPNAGAWDGAIKAVAEDRAAFEQLLSDAGESALISPFPWGDGQTLLHEALLIADHTAYHVGELIVLRRLLGAWKR